MRVCSGHRHGHAVLRTLTARHTPSLSSTVRSATSFSLSRIFTLTPLPPEDHMIVTMPMTWSYLKSVIDILDLRPVLRSLGAEWFEPTVYTKLGNLFVRDRNIFIHLNHLSTPDKLHNDSWKSTGTSSVLFLPLCCVRDCPAAISGFTLILAFRWYSTLYMSELNWCL